MLFQRNNCHFTSLFKSNIFLLKRNHIPWIPKNSNNLNNYCSSQIPVWLQACQFFFLAKKNLLLVVFGLVLDFVFNNIHAGVILWIAELHVCLENVTLCLPAWCVWVWWPQKKLTAVLLASIFMSTCFISRITSSEKKSRMSPTPLSTNFVKQKHLACFSVLSLYNWGLPFWCPMSSYMSLA